MQDPRVAALLERLRASRFAELEGARATLSLPIPESLVNEAVATFVPPSMPIRGLRIQLHAANRLTVTGRVAVSAWLPEIPVNVTLDIERQPRLPDTPLVLRMSPGLVSMVGSLFSSRVTLPPGVRLEGERVLIDVRALLESRGFGEALFYVDDLSVTTEDRLLMVSGSARVGGTGAGSRR
jgi:hypothetical protein